MRLRTVKGPWEISGALAALTFWLFASPAGAQTIAVGDPLPDFAFEDLNGDHYEPARMQGDILLIYVLGYSCGVCAEIAADLETDFNQAYRQDGLKVFAVDAWNGTYEDLQRMHDQSSARYPILMQGGGFAQACGLSYNSFLVVDGVGTVRLVREGPDPGAYDQDAIQTVVEELLSNASVVKVKTWGQIKDLYGR